MIINIFIGILSTILSLGYLTDLKYEILKKDVIKNGIFCILGIGSAIILAFQYQVSGVFLGFFAATMLTLMLSYQDITVKEVDEALLVFGVVLAAPIIFINPMTSFLSSIVGIFVIGGSVLLIAFLTKESIGYADGLLIAIFGAMLGWQLALTILILAFAASSVFGLIVLTFKFKNRKDHVPFIPFLLISLMFVQFI